MTTTTTEDQTAHLFIKSILNDFRKRYPQVEQLGDCFSVLGVDYIEMGNINDIVVRLESVGYQEQNLPVSENRKVFVHPNNQLPRILVRQKDYDSFYAQNMIRIAIKCDSLIAAREKWKCKTLIKGVPGGPYASCFLNVTDMSNVILVERHDYQGFMPPDKL